ncbi:MAG: acyltransferase [Roseinatronobacter sp.]
MNRFSFAECRARFEIDETFADDNFIETDGPLEALPRMSFKRHGGKGNVISGCAFHVASSAGGNVAFFLAESDAVVSIGPHTRLNCDIRLWRSATVTIGAYTTINQARLVADDSDIVIGEDCMFSDSILIQSADQHGLIDLESMTFLNAKRRRIELGDHVWVGRRAIVMPDVTIGDGSVIGTASLVTKDASACSFVVGVPARVVRAGSSWTRLPGKINQREAAFFEKMRAVVFITESD